jgi:Nif-specific regulatory protein
MRARLVILRGEGVPPVLELDPSRPISLGRSRDNDLVLHDEHASRQHARIYCQDDQWILRDCGTRNGTRVNAARVENEVTLLDGHEIEIADMRLRFSLLGGNGFEADPVPAQDEAGPETPGCDGLPLFDTPLQQDELTVLHDFMTAAITESSPCGIVQRMLSTVCRQTRATVAGFLSLDEEQPLPKMVHPELARVDYALSRQLTQRVQKEHRAAWLKGGIPNFEESESLLPFQDAVCVPLKAEGAPLGALHVYKSGGFFTERDVRFCKVVAGYAATALARLRTCRSLEAENSRLRVHAPVSDQIIGTSPAIEQLLAMIAKAAPVRSTVLIHGETGAGKELVALALHRNSPRRRGPLVVANCGAIPPTLLESELFGHEKGAFTGADAARPGLFRQADDGTLFLDEVGDMTLACQVKLLRVIEGMGFRPVGGVRDVRCDVRVIAATHKDLAQEVRAGKFRQDLYFRLRVIYIPVPPLREHREDIPALIDHFLNRVAADCGKRKRIAPAALKRLQEYAWPGNVRELRTVIESAALMSDGDTIEERDLWLQDVPMATDQPGSLNLEQLEAWAILQALRKTKGNVSHAARILGIARETLILKMKKYEISKEEWNGGGAG